MTWIFFDSLYIIFICIFIKTIESVEVSDGYNCAIFWGVGNRYWGMECQTRCGREL
jgi:hypothetical protein